IAHGELEQGYAAVPFSQRLKAAEKLKITDQEHYRLEHAVVITPQWSNKVEVPIAKPIVA
ncbi:hypothetical protein Tco_1295652, partial [Tanacetum coccineum]